MSAISGDVGSSSVLGQGWLCLLCCHGVPSRFQHHIVHFTGIAWSTTTEGSGKQGCWHCGGGGGVGGGGCQMKGCKLGSGNETATGKVSDVHFHNHLSSAVCWGMHNYTEHYAFLNLFFLPAGWPNPSDLIKTSFIVSVKVASARV